MRGESIHNAYEWLHNQKFHREHEELHETLADVLHDSEDLADADRFRAGLLKVASRAHNIASIRLQKYMRLVYASSNKRGRLLELRAFQILAMGLNQLATHVVSHPPRGLHRYCSNAVIWEIADLAYFIFYPATANKADIAERWLENV